MFDRKQYRFGFDVWALALFFLLMCPNLIWFAVPAQNDILRGDSVTEAADAIARAAQAAMIGSLCVIVNESGRKSMSRNMKAAIAAFCVLYAIGWIFYYAGIPSKAVIVDLCAAPCAAFILFAVARKNAVALLFALVFAVCHVIYAAVNFII